MADPRLTAVHNLLAVLDGHSLDDVLAKAPPADDDRDRALSAELSYGVCRWYRRLDALVAALLKKPFKSRDRDLHVLLLVAAYQLLYSRVPAHAAVSTAVEASRALGKAWASKLINAVLRRLLRERESLETRVDADAALRYAQPDWLFDAIQLAWPAQADVILSALQERPPMVLRIDQRQVESLAREAGFVPAEPGDEVLPVGPVSLLADLFFEAALEVGVARVLHQRRQAPPALDALRQPLVHRDVVTECDHELGDDA